MDTYSTLTAEARGHVWSIGLNRPDKRNAFNIQMLTELSEAMTHYEDTPDLWCAVLHAHGDHFTGGLDLAEVGPKVASEGALWPEGHIDPLGLSGRARTKPLICAVQGWCITIGIELLLASDIVIAADNTRFAQMEVQRGIMPFGGATLRLPRQVGWGHAMRLLLTGDPIDAAEAYRIGLVQQLVSPERLLDEAHALADRIAAQAPLAVQASLRSATLAYLQGEEVAAAQLMTETQRLMSTDDAREGVMSFMERRQARFKGR
ncbi:MAG: crotonase/enoyl-CoA hydratase family protein [Myxococcota bacterium]